MKALVSASENELEEFFRSVDYVFCDVDGVLWHFHQTIPGSREALQTLKSLNKKIIYVSNNSTKTQDEYYAQLKSAGYDLEKSDLVRPTTAIIHFLKKNNITKDIFVLGMKPLQTELEAEGFKTECFRDDNPEESIAKYIKSAVTINKNVGAVVADLDVNMTVGQLQKAATYLRNPEVYFITGGPDKQLCFGPDQIFIGPGAYHDILIDISGRKPHCLGKPSPEFNDFIKEKFRITDPSRVLFIGDSVPQDMGFATNCGYKKLLVLSGLTSKETVNNWTFPEQYKPDYYVDSLADINDMFK